MADAKTTLEIIIAATDSTGSAFTGVGNRISTLSGAVSDVTAPFAALAGGVLALDAALIALAAGGLALAVTKSGEFSEAFAEVGTIAGANSTQLSGFREDVLDYAAGSTKSLQEINAAVYEAISTGVSYEKSLAVVATAEQLAVGGKANLADSLKVLVSSLNAYGASTDEATNYADALFVAVKVGATTMPELSQSLANVTTIAATAGISFDEILAAIAALTASGVPTATAVESIRSAISNVIKPTEMAKQEAARLGLEFNAAALKTKGLSGFLEDLASKTKGSIESTALLIGDVTGLTAVMSLTGTGAKIFGVALEEMKTKTGAAAKAYAQMVDEFSGANQNLANNADIIWIQIGDKIITEYKALVASLTTILQTLGTAIDAGTFSGLFAIIETAMKDAAKYLAGIAKAIPEALNAIDFSGLTKALGVAGNALGGLFGGLDLTKSKDLTTVIQKVIDSLESLINFSNGMVQATSPIVAAIGLVADGFNALSPSAQEVMGQLTLILAAVAAVAAPLGAFGLAVSGVGALMTTAGLSAAGLVAALAGPAGIVAAIAVSTGAVLLAVKGFQDWQAAENEAKAAADRAAVSATNLAEKYKDISASTGYTITSLQELKDGIESGRIVQDKATGAYYDAESALGKLATAAQTAADKNSGLTDRSKLTTAELTLLTYEARETGPAMDAAGKAALALQNAHGPLQKAVEKTQGEMSGWVKTMVDGIPTYTQVGGAMSSIVDPAEKTTKALAAAAKQSKETETKMLELASNERIKAMEFSASINIAGIEAGTKQIEAAFNSINAGIESTGTTWTTLWDMVGSVGGSAGGELNEAIKREEERRQSEFDQQKELNNQLVTLNQLRIDSLRSGGSLIEIDGKGLEPEIEAFMFKILGRIQTRVSADYGAFLLGV